MLNFGKPSSVKGNAISKTLRFTFRGDLKRQERLVKHFDNAMKLASLEGYKQIVLDFTLLDKIHLDAIESNFGKLAASAQTNDVRVVVLYDPLHSCEECDATYKLFDVLKTKWAKVQFTPARDVPNFIDPSVHK